ncbi:hypothetical protein L227DRAFT_60553 [Lentinus tigrinus ALCF2SS1-6]|uniref:Uncharacterized protein n=1 Tax=Lentinus tigrinus ALCF2SS1-6 TaxID=1328759 RepID=A0A5C2SEV6_9APHY|nr:hypothetical protein L227DRAFT_60553 [Lentinus tigrinus ALCF2SS1-6]
MLLQRLKLGTSDITRSRRKSASAQRDSLLVEFETTYRGCGGFCTTQCHVRCHGGIVQTPRFAETRSRWAGLTTPSTTCSVLFVVKAGREIARSRLSRWLYCSLNSASLD